MEEIYTLLNSSYLISNISIENPFQFDTTMSVIIEIKTSSEHVKRLKFTNVSGVSMERGNFGDAISDHPRIIIEDISEAQLENKKYLVTILEDAMVFYCNSLALFPSII